MKHLESYRQIGNKRKVYWIVPFDNRFEDALVKTFIQYIEKDIEKDNDIQKIELINSALEFANDTRTTLKNVDFALLSMEFEYDEYDKLVMSPQFKIWEFDDKEYLDKDKYIYIGMINTDKEEVEIKTQSSKYNL